MKPHGRKRWGSRCSGSQRACSSAPVSVVRFVQATALAAVIFITASAAFFLV